MTRRSRDLLARYELSDALSSGVCYEWDLEAGVMAIGDVSFSLVTVGTVAGDSFLWSWANDSIPDGGKQGLDRVRAFGVEHELPLLVEPIFEGGLAVAKQCLSIAGRVLDADGCWIDRTVAGHILFLVLDDRAQPAARPAPRPAA